MTATDSEVVELDGHRLTLTNLDKVLYPETGTTKADVIGYYNAVADAKSASTEADAAEKVTVRKYTRHGSRHWKRHAQHKSEKVALKSSSRKKADAPDTAADSADVST